MPVRKPSVRRNLEQREKALEQRKLQERLKRLSPSERKEFLRKLILLKRKSSGLQKKVVTSKPQVVKKDSAQRKEKMKTRTEKRKELEKQKIIAERKREFLRRQAEARKRMELRKKIAERKKKIAEKQKRELMIKKIGEKRKKELERQKLIAERKSAETRVIGKPNNRRTVIKEVDFTPRNPFRRENLRQVSGMERFGSNANLKRNPKRERRRKDIIEKVIKPAKEKAQLKEKSDNQKNIEERKKYFKYSQEINQVLDKIGWQYENKILELGLQIGEHNVGVETKKEIGECFKSLEKHSNVLSPWMPKVLELGIKMAGKGLKPSYDFYALGSYAKDLEKVMPKVLELGTKLVEKGFIPSPIFDILGKDANKFGKWMPSILQIGIKMTEKEQNPFHVLNVFGRNTGALEKHGTVFIDKILELRAKMDEKWLKSDAAFNSLSWNNGALDKWMPSVLDLGIKMAGKLMDPKNTFKILIDNSKYLKKWMPQILELGNKMVEKEIHPDIAFTRLGVYVIILEKWMPKVLDLGTKLVEKGLDPSTAFYTLGQNVRNLEKHGNIIFDKFLKLGINTAEERIGSSHLFKILGNSNSTLEKWMLEILDMSIELTKKGIYPTNSIALLSNNANLLEEHGKVIIDKFKLIALSEHIENNYQFDNFFGDFTEHSKILKPWMPKILDFVLEHTKNNSKEMRVFGNLAEYSVALGDLMPEVLELVIKAEKINVNYLDIFEALNMGSELRKWMPNLLKIGNELVENRINPSIFLSFCKRNPEVIKQHGLVFMDKLKELMIEHKRQRDPVLGWAFDSEPSKNLSLLTPSILDLAIKMAKNKMDYNRTLSLLGQRGNSIEEWMPKILELGNKMVDNKKIPHSVFYAILENRKDLHVWMPEILDLGIRINGEGLEQILYILAKNRRFLMLYGEKGKEIYRILEKSVKKRIAPNALFALINGEGLERAKEFLESRKARDDLERDILFYSKHRIHTYENYKLSFKHFLNIKRRYENIEIPEPFVSGEKVIKLKQSKFDVNLSSEERTVLRKIVRGLSDKRKLRELVIQGIEDKGSNGSLGVLGDKFKGKKEELLKQVSEMSDKELVSRIKRLFRNKPKKDELMALLPVYKEIAILKNPQLEWIRNVKLEETMVSLNQISEAINEATGKGIKEVDGLKNIRVVKSKGKESLEVKLVPSKEVEDVFFGYFGPCCVNNEHSAIMDKDFTPIRMTVGDEIVGTVFLFKTSSNNKPVYVLAGIEPRAVLYNKVSPDALVKGVISKVKEYAEEEGAIVAQHPHNAAYSNVDVVKSSLKKVCGRGIKLDSYVGFSNYKTKSVLIV